MMASQATESRTHVDFVISNINPDPDGQDEKVVVNVRSLFPSLSQV